MNNPSGLSGKNGDAAKSAVDGLRPTLDASKTAAQQAQPQPQGQGNPLDWSDKQIDAANTAIIALKTELRTNKDPESRMNATSLLVRLEKSVSTDPQDKPLENRAILATKGEDWAHGVTEVTNKSWDPLNGANKHGTSAALENLIRQDVVSSRSPATENLVQNVKQQGVQQNVADKATQRSGPQR